MNSEQAAPADKYADYSREELLAEIKRLKKSKKYGLVWEHKKEQVIEDFETQQPYLQEVTEKRIENAPGEPTNLIIEGDNFEALSILNYTHAGKVDVIYIDPPYNTGNKDFIYNDDYVDSEDEFRHSKWLSFMEPRLKLAKNLLKDDGVIFISIDDNEQATLKALCDAIYGEENFVQLFIWHKKTQPSFLSKQVANVTEYIVCYRRREQLTLKGGVTDVNKLVELLNISNSKCTRLLPAKSLLIKNEDYSGKIVAGTYGNGELAVTLKRDIAVKNGRADSDVELYGRFKWTQEKINEEIEDGALILIKTLNTLRPTVKRTNNTQNIKPPISLLSKYVNGIATNTDASNELKQIFGGIAPMDFPKPSGLIKYITNAKTFDDGNAIILDFFAGSGTTGQAVLELNKEDGGHRQFILCTNNGDKGPDSVKIAEDITYPRIKTVITGERQDGSKYSDGIPANLRYYKIGHVEKKQSIDANRLEIVNYLENIIQVKENSFNQLDANEDFVLYRNSERFVGMVFEPFALEEIIEQIKEKNPDNLPTKLYVFSYSRDAFDDDFDADFEIEFVAMPEGLLKTYANIVAETKKEDA